MDKPDFPPVLNGKTTPMASSPLITDLDAASAACRRYRDYISARYYPGYEDGHTAYLLTREDIMSLLQDQELDGIRIYIGHEEREKGPLVRLYMVGCRKQDGIYEDVISDPPAAIQTFASMSAAATLTTGRPCPSECSGKNTLNS